MGQTRGIAHCPLPSASCPLPPAQLIDASLRWLAVCGIVIAMNPFRLLIIAADPLARAGLTALLSNLPSLTVVAQVGLEADFPSQLNLYHPDVALWDLGWSATSALERLGAFAELGIPSLALLPDEALAAQAWTAGARGLLLRTTSTETLVAAITSVGQGLVVLAPALASVATVTRATEETMRVEHLTPRELEVLRALADGLANKEIARRLAISEHTVKFHINALLGKLGAQSRTEAVVRATRAGLILL